jgi:anaerobic selenocysteine-containing dehydrogenase
MEAGTLQVFIGMGGNLAAAAPDTRRTFAALARCALTVQVSTKPNRSHFIHGREAYILPALGRTERDLTGGRPQAVTVEDSMSMVHASQGINAPAGAALRSEVDIIASLAARTLEAGPVDWLALRDDYDRIRDLIEKAIPGFDRFNERVRVPGLPPAQQRARTRVVHRQRAGGVPRRHFAHSSGVRRTLHPDDGAQPRPVQHHGVWAG